MARRVLGLLVLAAGFTAAAPAATLSPPVNVERPTLSGTAMATLTVQTSTGTWTGTEPISYSYQWRRCDTSGASCTTIAGATGPSYTLTAAEVGGKVYSLVTASNTAGTASMRSYLSATVAAAPTTPFNTERPALSGTAREGQTVQTSSGSWIGTQPISYAYQWRRCDTSGANCTTIAGATGPSYTLTAAEVGGKVYSLVTASNTAGTASMRSYLSATVAAAATGFVQRSGKTLVLNGSPYRFTGLNVYYANSRGGCGPTVDLGSSLGAWGAGKEAFRAWFFQSLATKEGGRNWTAFDQTLAAANARGYRVIVTLANQWADCDQGYGYKTDTWYRSGYRTKDPLGTVSYRDYVAEIVSRYKNDPTILMWQLMNEAEAKTSQTGSCPSDAPQVLKTWATDVSGLVKSIDPNHLVSLGTLGSGACGTSYTEYQTVHDIPTIDLCEYHDYGYPNVPMPGNKWNGLQAEINFCTNLNKPLFVGETGINEEAVGGLEPRATAFGAKFAAQFEAGVVGEVVWTWNSSSGGLNVGPGDPTLGVLGSY